MNQPFDVVGAIIVRDSSVRVAQRGPGRALEGKWEFPGGKVERGERPEMALAREVHEELNCSVEIGARVTTTTHDYHFGVIRLTTYYATVTAGQPAATEHAALRWVRIEELQDLNWAPADLPAVQEVLRDYLRS
ncbi:(deoxy)nucleoside triphosphate pyrophosphohydrolase [Microbacterium sp.]|uniref:(deoxy)nucleoside triphosphate pyrophosphohydrolase n=1 Tax=Microbacterium sp. TaxID=51671 RepID=UPI00281183F6|nr:(deoxy)nucleoside triphosphate pyrophosphohydrolase [Microbacterium sp.]